MGKETSNTNGSHEPAAITVDTKGACALIGISRQQLHKIRKDSAMNLPEAFKIGSSVRWFVSELMAWMQSMKPSNTPQNASSVNKTVALKAGTGRQAEPEKPRSRFLLNPTKVKVVPTVAELAATNRKVQAMKRQPGQHLLRRMIDTRDGARDWQYYVFPLVPGKGVTPVKISPRKILVPTGMPEAERQQLLARATAIRAAAAGLVAPAVLATRKGDTNAQRTHVSLTEMKAAYEVEGKSLDELCRRYRMGKGSLSRLLHEAGTKMRPPGRKSRPSKA